MMVFYTSKQTTSESREDVLKEAQYGDAFYLCTIIFNSDFAVKQGGKAYTIKQALKNKISSLTTRAKLMVGNLPGK